MRVLLLRCILLLLFIHPLSSTHHDDGIRQPETYDDSWMNELQKPKLKGKPRTGIEEDSSYEPGSAPSDIIEVGKTVGVSAQEETGRCPASHPNVYYNGEYCCQSGREKVYTPQGDKCDGSAIQRDSMCCEGDIYIECPSGNCDSLNTDECRVAADKDGSAYRGTVAVTSTGLVCQRWDSQYPNSHSRTNQNYPSAGLEENYCRNPDGESSAWCYNGEGTNPRWYFCDIPKCVTGFADKQLDNLERRIKGEIRKLNVEDIKNYLKSDDSLAVLQWQLLKNLKEGGLPIDLQDETISWLFNDREAMENLLTSGDIDDNRWKEAIEILAEIIRQDSNAKQGLKLKLAVAIGLTFSSNVYSMAHGGKIDGIARYHNYAQWADEELLFEPFYNLNAWQLRYVVGSWAEDDELVWARKNALEEFRNPNKIGSVTHSMVEYNLYNADNISVHDPGYYYGKPVTLEWIHTIGGVCGAISKFGTGMAQAFGIPGLPVGQPGHCAFIWLKNGTTWNLDNDISGWAESTTHTGIQYTWKLQAPFFPMMNEAQLNLNLYRLSEKMRIIAGAFAESKHRFLILEDATTICPQNYDLWYDMTDAISDEKVDENILQRALSPILQRHEEKSREVKNIAKGKAARASAYQELASKITDESSEWWSNETTAWVEIDLDGPCIIMEVRIHWWGISYSNDYDLYAETDGEFKLVRTHEEEDRSDSYYNPWGTLQGWSASDETSKIRLVMRDGNIDPWYGKYYFGIRQIMIVGKELGNEQAISVNKAVKTNKSSGGDKLVDGDYSTYWASNAKNSWIKIDLDGLCVVNYLLIDWLDDVSGKQKIQYKVGGKSTLLKKGRFSQLKVKGLAGEINIKLQKSKSYSIREVTAVGFCYDTRDILKMKAYMGFEQPDTAYAVYVFHDISEMIQEFKCTLC